MRRELERIEIPGEHEARERTLAVVRAAFAERELLPRRRRRLRAGLLLAIVAAVVAAAATAPGRAVLGGVRNALLPVRVERAQPALFALPASGRLLVSSSAGVWVVEANGSKRLLAGYREGSWSPFGRYVVAVRRNELAALEPDGTVRWTLARPRVRFPRWTGTSTDTRIAYLSGSRLHVVAGDGTDDVDAGGLPAAAPVAPAWRSRPPGARTLAYVDTRGRVSLYEPVGGAEVFRTPRLPGPRALAWSPNGTLAIATRAGVVVYAGGRRIAERPLPGVVALAYAPDGSRLAVLRRNELLLYGPRLRAPRRLFAGGGRLAGLAWSPDGRWLLAGWPTADQWLFVRAAGRQRIVAVSNVAAQFRSSAFPRIEGWCCAP